MQSQGEPAAGDRTQLTTPTHPLQNQERRRNEAKERRSPGYRLLATYSAVHVIALHQSSLSCSPPGVQIRHAPPLPGLTSPPVTHPYFSPPSCSVAVGTSPLSPRLYPHRVSINSRPTYSVDPTHHFWTMFTHLRPAESQPVSTCLHSLTSELQEMAWVAAHLSPPSILPASRL